MSLEETITNRSALIKSRRQAAQKGSHFTRVVFKSLNESTSQVVTVTRVTTNCIYLNDGARIKKDSGVLITKSEGVVSYIPE